jgi:hypothetical protein
MPLRIACPFCGHALKATSAVLDKKVRCGNCQEVFLAVAPAGDDQFTTDRPRDDMLPRRRRRDDDYDDFDDDDDYPRYRRPRRRRGSQGSAIASLVLGIVGMVACCLPILGFPVTITGLCLGIVGLRSRGQAMAIAGVILNSIGLLLTILNAVAGFFMAATGRHPFFR